jgi:hypothetical protein
MLAALGAGGQLDLVVGCGVAQHAVSMGKGLLGMAESLHLSAELLRRHVGMLNRVGMRTVKQVVCAVANSHIGS